MEDVIDVDISCVTVRPAKLMKFAHFGQHLASEIKLNEFSFNRKVLRVNLPKVDIKNLPSDIVASNFIVSTGTTRKSRRLNRLQLENRKKLNNKLSNKFNEKPNLRRRGCTKDRKRKLTENLVNPSSYTLRSKDSKRRKIYSKPKYIRTKRKKKMTTSVKPHHTGGPGSNKPGRAQFIIRYVSPSSPRYCLKTAPVKHPQDGKRIYPFDDLVKDIKNMKLPSPTWKIKVVVKSNNISSLIFTNKCVLERTVSFNARSVFYDIIIENRPAILLGSPNEVNCVEDVEILLNIIHTISAKNPMVHYKN